MQKKGQMGPKGPDWIFAGQTAPNRAKNGFLAPKGPSLTTLNAMCQLETRTRVARFIFKMVPKSSEKGAKKSPSPNPH